MTDHTAKRRAFRDLHQSGCFVMPNPWDIGSAVALQAQGFRALATTSAGMAWALGRRDGAVPLDEVLDHMSSLASRLAIPLNADFENAFADAPEQVAVNVARAVETGVAGLSVEDSTGSSDRPLYDFDLAVSRIAAARAAIDRQASGVLLTARSEGFIRGRPDLAGTILRLKAFAEAGADCLYAPGLSDEEQIREVVNAVAPKPVNILTFGMSVADLAKMGVRRISVGGALAGVAWGAFLQSAREIAQAGTFAAFGRGAPGSELNRLFEPDPGAR